MVEMLVQDGENKPSFIPLKTTQSKDERGLVQWTIEPPDAGWPPNQHIRFRIVSSDAEIHELQEALGREERCAFELREQKDEEEAVASDARAEEIRDKLRLLREVQTNQNVALFVQKDGLVVLRI